MDFESEVGQIMGTVGYRSPEQVRGITADYRSDIFSFGAVLCDIQEVRCAFEEPPKHEMLKM